MVKIESHIGYDAQKSSCERTQSSAGGGGVAHAGGGGAATNTSASAGGGGGASGGIIACSSSLQATTHATCRALRPNKKTKRSET